MITGALYYSTLPPQKGIPPIAANRASVLRNKTELARLNDDIGAREIWRLLNPGGRTLVHVRVESPAILALDLKQDADSYDKRSIRPRWRGLRPLWWCLKFIILPIGSTLGGLYALLLYLLKGTERLEVHHDASADEAEYDAIPMTKKPAFKVFPRAFATDVVLLASNADGSVIASVSGEGETYVWRLATHAQLKVDTSEIVLEGASGSSLHAMPSCIALNNRGTYCAVGTASGIIGIWAISGSSARIFTQYSFGDCRDAVVQLEFCDMARSPTEPEHVASRAREEPCLVSTFADGRVAICDSGKIEVWRPYTAGQVTRALIVRASGIEHPFICFCLDDGVVEIIGASQTSEPDIRVVLQAGTPSDQVVDVAVCRINTVDLPRSFVAAATESGSITVWDGLTENDHSCG